MKTKRLLSLFSTILFAGILLASILLNSGASASSLDGFDKTYYLAQKLAALQSHDTSWADKTVNDLDVLLSSLGFTAESHYSSYGYIEGLDPNPYFSHSQYLLSKASALFQSGSYVSIDEAKTAFISVWPQDTYLHYLLYGAAEGLNPSDAFDESQYLKDKLESLQSSDPSWMGKSIDDLRATLNAYGLTPLVHYLDWGSNEGITPSFVPVSERVWASAINYSTTTLCAEEDNINIPLIGNLLSYTIEATHPVYDVGEDNCAANFTNCSGDASGYPFTAGTYRLFDDGNTVVEAVRENQWWRPNGMQASVNGEQKQTDIHYIRIYRKISDADEWPQFLVLYMDGNTRLIPHPPEGRTSVCFGSSVIVGYGQISQRPYAEIESVNYISDADQIQVNYTSGATSTIQIDHVNRTSAKVTVVMDEDSGETPFATFRSMYVDTANADADRVEWQDIQGVSHSSSVMEFTGGDGLDWLFKRSIKSVHNTSAPDIRITLK